MNKEKFGELLRSSGKSKEQIAKDLELSSRQLRRYELGEHQPSAEILARICKYFKVSADWLLDL